MHLRSQCFGRILMIVKNRLSSIRWISNKFFYLIVSVLVVLVPRNWEPEFWTEWVVLLSVWLARPISHLIGYPSTSRFKIDCYSQANLESKLDKAIPKAWTAHIGYLKSKVPIQIFYCIKSMALVKLVFPYQLVWLLTLLKHVYSIVCLFY